VASATEARNGSDCTTSTNANRSILERAPVRGVQDIASDQQRVDDASQKAGLMALRVVPPLAVRTKGR
jgi:hypothetical protein